VANKPTIYHTQGKLAITPPMWLIQQCEKYIKNVKLNLIYKKYNIKSAKKNKTKNSLHQSL
jgi:hypothetical protein